MKKTYEASHSRTQGNCTIDRDQEALRVLNSTKASGSAKRDLSQMRGSDDMAKWLEIIGCTNASLKALNIIHVAGTNGKGGTCTLASSFLRHHGISRGFPSKVGLYTSPHIENIRERIQINNEPVTKELFTTSFFEVWAKLPREPSPELDTPRYLQLLALLSFYIFVVEKVDVAVYETHMGGEYDATNIVSDPVAAGVTTIAMDHEDLLGPDITDIAWHKAGIFKSGARAFSMPQSAVVQKVLCARARERGVDVTFIDLCSSGQTQMPAIQALNSKLAQELVQAWLTDRAPPGHELSVQDVAQGLKDTRWPGRFETILEAKVRWFLDGAHNKSALSTALSWYAAECTGSSSNIKDQPKVLVFSHFSRRDVKSLLDSIAESSKSHSINFFAVVFTTYTERIGGSRRLDKNQGSRSNINALDQWEEHWKQLDEDVHIFKEPTIEEALKRVRTLGCQVRVDVLITGSLRLISGALPLLRRAP